MATKWKGSYCEYWPEHNCIAIWCGAVFVGAVTDGQQLFSLVKEIAMEKGIPGVLRKEERSPGAMPEEEKRKLIADWLAQNDPRESTRRLRAMRLELEGKKPKPAAQPKVSLADLEAFL